VSGLRVIAGASFSRVGPSGEHDLARAARTLDTTALAVMAAILADGLERDAPEVAAAADAVVVPMAGHLAGSASGPARQLAAALVVRFPRWSITAALLRLADAPAAVPVGLRVATDEAATLRWDAVPGAGPVIIVDDVVHSGASLEAAWLAAPPGLRARLLAAVVFRAVD
jgi:hypothetical protein